MRTPERTLSMVAASCLASSPVFAADDYRCTVSRIESQSVSAAVLSLSRKTYVGQEFTVERRTGIMAGALRNSFATSPAVIDHGSKDNSYKVVTTMRLEQGAGRGSMVYVLVINEYEETAQKAFTFFDGESVYFGACKHF